MGSINYNMHLHLSNDVGCNLGCFTNIHQVVSTLTTTNKHRLLIKRLMMPSPRHSPFRYHSHVALVVVYDWQQHSIAITLSSTRRGSPNCGRSSCRRRSRSSQGRICSKNGGLGSSNSSSSSSWDSRCRRSRSNYICRISL
jgi:hypothetical protein